MADKLAPLILENTVRSIFSNPIGAMLPSELCQRRQRPPSGLPVRVIAKEIPRLLDRDQAGGDSARPPKPPAFLALPVSHHPVLHFRRHTLRYLMPDERV